MNNIIEEQELEIEALNYIIQEKNYEILEYQKLLQEKEDENKYLILLLQMNKIYI